MSNYESSGVDFDTIFQARTSTAGPNTNYEQSGVDLAQTYEPLSRDQQIPDINYQKGGVNLATLLMANDAQYTLTTGKLTSTRTTAWNTEVEHRFEVTFASATARTNFFLYGGRIKINASRTGGSSSSKNTDWTNMLSTMGDVELGKTNTYRNNSIQSSTVGSDDLTGSNQTLYSASGSGAYSANEIKIQAAELSTTVIRIRVRFRDLATGNPSIDENADGTLTSTVDERRHSSQATASYATTIPLTSGS